jgi:type I restriction enzyme S subunit
MSFPRYPAYKDSGVEWLGEVPAHWEVAPLGRMTLEKCDGPFGSGLKSEHYVDAGVRVIRLQNIRRSGFDGTDEAFIDSEYFLDELARHEVRAGDVLIAGLGDENHPVGRACVAPPDIEPAMVKADCFRFRVDVGRAEPSFVALALTAGAAEAAGLLSSGSTRSRIPLSVMSSRRLAMPPLSEQRAVVAFLDRETGTIDALVEEQRRLIALLKEKRQAVISHAVTRGLNPDAPMKPSGIDWLGDIPAHWELTPLARITLEKCDGPFGSGLKSEHYVDSGVRVIRLQNLRSSGFDGGDSVFIDTEYFETELARHSVQAEDLLIAGLGDENNTVGRACVAPIGIEPALVKADCFRFRVDRRRAYPQFVALALTSGAVSAAGLLSSGSTRSRIPLSVMASRRLAVPPVEEQVVITGFLERESATIDTLTAEAERAIALLQERRTALISAAVTGQIDVRELV